MSRGYRFRRRKRAKARTAKETLRPKVERLKPEEEPTPSVVLVVPALSVEVRRTGDDLVFYVSGEERARMDVGPLAKDLKASAMDLLIRQASERWGLAPLSLLKKMFKRKD